MTTKFQNDGFELVKDFLSAEDVATLIQAVENHPLRPQKGGVRNADKLFPKLRMLVNSPKMITAAQNYLTNSPQLVRVILFDKTPNNNWLVAWHQDKTIAVSAKKDMPGWGPWTVKQGIHHVQPPLAVLNDMVTFRFHLDDATLDNGCLRVIAGSHNLGILAAPKVAEYAAIQTLVTCEAKAGAAFIMRPHLIHGSSKASNPGNRRIIHVEYSGYALPEGLAWA